MKKDIQNIHIDCPVCNDRKCNPVIDSCDYFLTHESFHIFHCFNCGCRFTYPRPEEQIIGKYYESSSYISHSGTQKGISSQIYYMVRRFMIRAKIRILLKYKTFGNILDIGCGTGEFLNEIEKSNFSATGIEPNTLARNFAISKYNLNVLDENEIDHLAGSNYNIITLWHVLEHVYDINFRIIQIRKLLAEEGILVIAVPNFDSWDAQHYQKYWAAYDLPRHLYHFNQQSINRLFQKHGFSLMKIRPMIFDSFYISIVSEKYKNSKSSFFKGILIGLFSNIWAFMNQKNYSSLIYIFKLNKT